MTLKKVYPSAFADWTGENSMFPQFRKWKHDISSFQRIQLIHFDQVKESTSNICNHSCLHIIYIYNGLVRFAEKTSWNIVLADLLWEKNTVPVEKTSWKVHIIRQKNRTLMSSLVAWFLTRFKARHDMTRILTVLCQRGKKNDPSINAWLLYSLS